MQKGPHLTLDFPSHSPTCQPWDQCKNVQRKPAGAPAAHCVPCTHARAGDYVPEASEAEVTCPQHSDQDWKLLVLQLPCPQPSSCWKPLQVSGTTCAGEVSLPHRCPAHVSVPRHTHTHTHTLVIRWKSTWQWAKRPGRASCSLVWATNLLYDLSQIFSLSVPQFSHLCAMGVLDQIMATSLLA